jgi:tRNA 2-thiouridine synthesizing protein A
MSDNYFMSQAIVEVDARAMNCPMPLLKAKQALNKLEKGDQLKVLATDAGSQRDFQVFCQQSGHILEQSKEHQGVFTYIICKQ